MISLLDDPDCPGHGNKLCLLCWGLTVHQCPCSKARVRMCECTGPYRKVLVCSTGVVEQQGPGVNIPDVEVGTGMVSTHSIESPPFTVGR